MAKHPEYWSSIKNNSYEPLQHLAATNLKGKSSPELS